MTLAEINDEFGAARTNKKEFLEKMDRIIPWETFVKLVQPCYYKGERGNKPYPLELMLRIFILQNLYDLGLDGITERNIRGNLSEVVNDKIVIIVTHSRNFIMDNSIIYNIDNHKIQRGEPKCLK